ILIGKFVDEEEYLRERSSDELSFWLKKNKPKTIRMNWCCPKKAESSFLKCGLRMDNLPLVYDSQNLPTTEEKWNKTVFFSKPHGSYKWPTYCWLQKIVSVVLQTSVRFHTIGLKKRLSLQIAEKLFEALFAVSQSCLILQRAEQRLAAELFTGVAKGTKYIGFKKLDQLWKWLAPAIDNLYDRMNADAYLAWQSCITD
ncbi:hypothetical protein OSTOST_24011, partial [Ostertagia ostertagi]